MEYCIETRALKSSFLSQMAVKTNSSNDDVWCLTGINSAPSDDFPVDDLLNLDFPDKEHEECFSPEDEEEKAAHEKNLSLCSSNFSGADELDGLSAGEPSVPADGLENLEWLSQFVDDSTSGMSLICPAVSLAGDDVVRRVNRVEVARKPVQKSTRVVPCFPFPVPVQRKARSNRRRPNGRPWYVASPPLSTTGESSSTSSSHGSSEVPPPFIFTRPVFLGLEGSEKPAAKRMRKKPEADGGRRCTHCQVQKTPQWRTGPLGPKTLCNACGVRFKSGRLFPEYRPACSPTFSQEMHSNSHRKVLEMRLKKETAQAG